MELEVLVRKIISMYHDYAAERRGKYPNLLMLSDKNFYMLRGIPQLTIDSNYRFRFLDMRIAVVPGENIVMVGGIDE